MRYLLDTSVCVMYLNGWSTAVASAGTPIGADDLPIGAIALVNNLTMVTHNTQEFERVEGLQIEDWEVGM
jgi:tRNA(fMet)-specific endonuclease VapC